QLADQLGPKKVLAAGVCVWSAACAATPTAASLGTGPLLAVRVLLGLGEGVAFPAVHSLIARHVPSDQQSTAVGITTAASYLGAAGAFLVTPLVIRTYDWQTAFQAFGALALLWLPAWLVFPLPPLLGKAAAQQPPLPSQPEGTLQSPPLSPKSTGVEDREPSDMPASLDLPAPPSGGGTKILAGLRDLMPLLQRREVIAICVAQYTQSWGLYGLINWLPTFFSDVYGVTLEEVGGFTFVPYVVQGTVGVAAGVLADKLVKDSGDRRRVRVMLQVLGMLGPGVCLIVAASPGMESQPDAARNIITAGLGLSALSLGGVSANHLDIAPRHAGAVFGAGNTSATIAGFLSVPVTGLLLDWTNSWFLVFGITAAHYFLGAIIYQAWAGGEVLPEDGKIAYELQ
ncbi:hypothetical protein CYMTET_20569, partial [Cymbomonas tetramitiformis]